MRRLSQTLYLAYGALFTWLAYSAVQSIRHGAAWSAVAFTVGTGLALAAAIREGDLEDALRREAVRAEREARPSAEDTITATACMALAAACCEVWWSTAGAEHDPEDCTRKDAGT